MDAIANMKLARLQNRVQVLEARNASLRAEVERLTIGQPAKWTPFQKADTAIFGDGRMIGHAGEYAVFLNSRYQVALFKQDDIQPGVSSVHVSIKRIDGAAVHDWRDFQRIKNELVGVEAEGAELYPAESRLVDGANQFHLTCLIGAHWPFGFRERLVCEDSLDGVQQRPFEEDQRPSDLRSVTADDMARAAGLED